VLTSDPFGMSSRQILQRGCPLVAWDIRANQILERECLIPLAVQQIEGVKIHRLTFLALAQQLFYFRPDCVKRYTTVPCKSSEKCQ
jgi:hypothetical protein